MTNTNTQFFVATVQPFQTSKYNDVSLQVPVIYEGQVFNYEDCGCHCHGGHSPHHDDTQYQVAELGSAVKGVFTGVADIIRACRTPSAGSAASSTGAGNTPAATSTEDNAKIAQLQKQVDELSALLQSKGDTPTADKVDFNSKWGKIEIEHEPQCVAYETAVQNGDEDAKKVNKAKLDGISTTVEGKIKELEKDLQGENVSDADKAIGEKAMKQLKDIQARIEKALSAKAPEAAEEVKTPDKQEPVGIDAEKEKRCQSNLDELKRKALAAQSALDVIRSNPSKVGGDEHLQAQKDAITAYNNWGDGVKNYEGDKTTDFYSSHMTDVKKGLDYIIGEDDKGVKHNGSAAVKDLVDQSSDLLSSLRTI